MPAVRLVMALVVAASCAACVAARGPAAAPLAYANTPPPGLILGVQ